MPSRKGFVSRTRFLSTMAIKIKMKANNPWDFPPRPRDWMKPSATTNEK